MSLLAFPLLHLDLPVLERVALLHRLELRVFGHGLLLVLG